MSIIDFFEKSNKDLHESLIDILKYSQMLENLLKYKNKEIKRLEYLNQHLVMSLDKRDEMLSHTIEENRKLKELTILYERMMDGSLHPRKRNQIFGTPPLISTFRNKSPSPGSPILKSPLSSYDITKKRASGIFDKFWEKLYF